MFNLIQYIQMRSEEQMRERGRNVQRPSEPLITTPQSPAYHHHPPSYNNDVIIRQPNQPLNELPVDESLRNLAHSIERGNAAQQENEDKININAALLSLVLYMCSLSMIIYGSIHFYDCPAQKMITITYIVMGCLMMVSRFLSAPEDYRNIFKEESQPQYLPQDLCRACFNLIVQIATMCFFFAMCHWIFHMNPDTKEGSSNYCEKDLYRYTYYGCIIALALLGIGFMLTCCGVCILVCKAIKD